jgi:hypothetical protein
MNIISDSEINNYKNGIILSQEIKTNTFILIGELNNDVLINSLIKDVKEQIEKEQNMHSYTTEVKALTTGFHSLREHPNIINFFHKIKSSIFKIYKKKFFINDAWGNIYSKPNIDFARDHNHMQTSAFCCIIYLTDGPGPGTLFNEYDLIVPEKKGRFVLFHPLLVHEVKPYPYTKERITIACNLHEAKPWKS